MKRKIKIIDNINKTEKELEIIERDPCFIRILEFNKHKVFKNKKKYSRKAKHKQSYEF